MIWKDLHQNKVHEINTFTNSNLFCFLLLYIIAL